MRPGFTAVLFFLFLQDPALRAESSVIADVPEIPAGSCSFKGDKLCPGIPGYVLQQHFQQGACSDSLQRLCGGVEPGDGRLAKCLKDNARYLDAKCVKWSQKVGLDFQKKEERVNDAQVLTDITTDPCFGSAWFTDPKCREDKSADTSGIPPVSDGLGDTSSDPFTTKNLFPEN